MTTQPDSAEIMESLKKMGFEVNQYPGRFGAFPSTVVISDSKLGLSGGGQSEQEAIKAIIRCLRSAALTYKTAYERLQKERAPESLEGAERGKEGKHDNQE